MSPDFMEFATRGKFLFNARYGARDFFDKLRSGDTALSPLRLCNRRFYAFLV